MRHLKFTFVALAATLFISCSNEEEVQSSYPSDNVVRIQTDINGTKTRASYTSGTLQEFGFSIMNNNNATYSYDNMKVEKVSGSWKPASQMLWQNATQPVDIIAYAPYNANVSGSLHNQTAYELAVGTDQTLADDHSDFLVYRKTGFVPQNDLVNSAVPVSFSHALSQLNINITFGSEYNTTALLTANPISRMEVDGTIIQGTCDFSTGTDVVASTNASTYTQTVKAAPTGEFTAATDKKDNAQTSYTCILIPQTISAGKFSVTIFINGKAYTWTSTDAVTLEKGTSHQLDLQVGKNTVIMGSFSSQPWADGSETTLPTD